MSETSDGAGSGSDKYRTLFELGQGGTANVSLAVARGPEGFKKLFVVKSLRSAYAGDPEFRAMFMNEARLSARLNHPNVVQVYEVFEQDGTPTILMEFIEGQTLDAVLALPDAKFPLELHLRVLADVLSGLHYSHELLDLKHEPLNVVHRDVSPHNVMVSYEGVVKVLDFGIAKLSDSAIETEAGVIKGKLRYMPPEQIAGERVDRRADVFAVGVMLWEALTGSKLWKGLSDATIMNRVLRGDIPSPKLENPSISPELEAICVRALAAERDERFQTALELELAIEEYLSKKSHYVSSREVGKFVAERFAVPREAISKRIEGELAQAEPSQRPPGSLSPRKEVGTTSRTSYTSSASLNGSAEAPRSRLWMLAVLFVGLGVLIAALGLRSRVNPADPRALPAAVSAPSAPRRVQIAIEASPKSAVISVDGVPVPNPYAGERAWDDKAHRVRVSAPGYVAEEIEVRFDADVRMLRALSPAARAAAPVPVPVPAPAPAPKSRAGASRPTPSASAVVPAPALDCEPPYVVDQRGIKKFKPECI